jgi:phosphoribosyl-ATP pyrophosphohydrolase/phosphoribosyl-AMP cyclohydrolase
MAMDCDSDALLVSAIPAGPTCHTGSISCFGDEVTTGAMNELFATIEKRKAEMPKGSYTTSLFKAGLDKIALKVSEESLEVVQAATKETKKRLVEETVDLIYHLFVLLSFKGLNLEEINKEIKNRARK